MVPFQGTMMIWFYCAALDRTFQAGTWMTAGQHGHMEPAQALEPS
jgi:hypothetical protein